MSAILVHDPDAVPLFEARHLSGGAHGNDPFRLAVDDVSLKVDVGEMVVTLGRAGAGKLPLARLLLGLDVPSAGHVRHQGVDVTHAGNAARLPFRQAVQAVFGTDDSGLDPRLSVADNIALGLRRQLQADRGEVSARVNEVLEQVGLVPAACRARRPGDLTVLQRRLVALARALAPRPTLLVAYEPLDGLDLSGRAQVLRRMLEWHQGVAGACLFLTSDAALARFAATRVLVMEQGRIVESGAADRVMSAPRHVATRRLLGLAA